MSFLSTLIGNYGDDLARATSKVASSQSDDILQAVARNAIKEKTNIPVLFKNSAVENVEVGKPEMVKLFRGVSAKSDDELANYINQTLDKTIEPKTYGGGAMQGEGYNFSTNRNVAEYFAKRAPQRESRAIISTEVPKNRFIAQNEQNMNRLQDFIDRAESRGFSYENGESTRQAIQDMKNYFEKNGILGVRSNSGETYVINTNDDSWMKNLGIEDALRGRGTRISSDNSLKGTLNQLLGSKENIPNMGTDFKLLDNDIFKNYGTDYEKNLYSRVMKGDVISSEDIEKSPFLQNMRDEEKKAIDKYGDYIISKAMSEAPETIPPETMKRLQTVGDDYIREARLNPSVGYDKKAVIFMGGPSSGKSSAGMKYFDASKGKGGNFFVLDSDDIKPMFEEFGKGEGAGITHEASAFTAENIVKPELMADGMNLAIPIVGKTKKSLYKQINSLVNNGYDVSVIKVDLPVEKAASRNFSRMLETGRNVPDAYVREMVGDKPSAVYNKMINDINSGNLKGVSGWARINNDVKLGENPIMEEYQQNDLISKLMKKLFKKK